MNPAKFRTKNQLDAFLTDEFTWRRREIYEARRMLDTRNITPSMLNFLLRAGMSVLYAHWEGFVKRSATAYVCFVAMQRLRYDELAPDFLALSTKHRVNQFINSKSTRIHMEVVNFFLGSLAERSSISWENAIDTQSNLSSSVFREIVEMLGLDYLSQYETKQHLIDEQLLRNRHAAAHGEAYLEYDNEGFAEVYKALMGDGKEQTLGLLELLRDQIVTASYMERFKNHPIILV